MIKQGLELSDKPHIVVATPGRLADHIDSGTDFSLERIRFLVREVVVCSSTLSTFRRYFEDC